MDEKEAEARSLMGTIFLVYSHVGYFLQVTFGSKVFEGAPNFVGSPIYFDQHGHARY